MEGSLTEVSHSLCPLGEYASYPPTSGLWALPAPTNTVSSDPAPSAATEGVESIGAPPSETGHPGTVEPSAR